MSHDPFTPSWEDRVATMLEDIQSIRSFIDGHTRETFGRDQKAVFAVCYAFVRLGEAIGQIPQAIRDAHPSVDWTNARKFRNFLIHVYMAVQPARLYDTATTDLAPLEAGLRAMLPK